MGATEQSDLIRHALRTGQLAEDVARLEASVSRMEGRVPDIDATIRVIRKQLEELLADLRCQRTGGDDA